MSSQHWTEAKLFKFLRLYKRYECLWNPYSPEYRNCDEKSEAFSQILYEMNVFGLTVNECLNQIKHIREAYKQEQQRLENLAFLGGRCHSNLLWYPIMNSMLSKVLQDEEKLNQGSGNSELVVVPKRLPLNYGDQENQSYLNRGRYGQRTVSWDPNETTICPYLPNSNLGDQSDCYPNSNISNKSIGAYEPNGHLSSCPTCGYSSSCSCNCYSMDDIGYYSGDIGQDYCSSHSQINYRPRTSYNYRNGILEINSAVRIPVSQPSPNFGCNSNAIKSPTPNDSQYNYTPIPINYQPRVQTVDEEEELSTECCAEYPDGKGKENQMSRECRSSAILDNAVNKNPNSPHLGIGTTSPPIKNINWSSERFKSTKKSIDEILCSQDLLELIDVVPNSICKSIKPENSATDDKDQVVHQENHISDTRHSPKVELKDSLDNKQEILVLNPQPQNHLNIKAEKAFNSKMNLTGAKVKIEAASTMASENEEPRKKDVAMKISRVEPERDEGFIHTPKRSQSKKLQTNCKLATQASGKTKIIGEHVINDFDENMSDPETTQDLVQKAKSIIKHNVTKILLDFIDQTLNKPGEKSTVNTEERLILKKVAKDLKALKHGSNHISNDKLAMENHQQLQQNHKTEFGNKTICWREPIEESLNIIPYKSSKFPANVTDCEKHCLVERPIQLNQGLGNRFRLMAGADFGIDSDIRQSNLFSQTSTRKKNETTATDDCSVFGNNNKKPRHANIISPTLEDHLMISVDRKLQCNDENNGLRNIDNERQITTMESNSNKKICEDQINNLEGNSCFSLQDMKIENSVMIHVSVETSGKTENEIINKVVNKITRILRKTLQNHGLAIEEKQFFTKKKLITNDNGEINRKLIGNEDVWKTELRNIILHLMKQKKIGDPITFKVKTMILPVTNQSNDTSEQEATNLAPLTKLKQKRGPNPETPAELHKSGADSQMRKDQYEISEEAHELFYRNGEKFDDEGNNEHEKPIGNSDADLKANRGQMASREKNYKTASKKSPTGKTEGWACNKQFTGFDSDIKIQKLNRELQFKKQLFKNQIRRSTRRSRYIIPRNIIKNVTHLEKILFNDANQIISPYKNYPHAMSKLIKYLVQFGKTFQSISKKTGKSLRSELQLENQYMMIHDRKFQQNQHKNDFITASFCDKLPHNLSQDIDVYLCTEISQEDQSSMQEQTVCDSLSDSFIHNDVNEYSLFTSTTIQKNSQMKGSANSCIQKTESTSEQDLRTWKSFCESDEETKISRSTVHASTNTPKNSIWDPKHAIKADERSNTIDQFTNKSYSMPSRANRSKNIPNLQNTCKIVNILSSEDQNISPNELRSSEVCSKASSCCAESEETVKPNESLIPKRTESEDGESLLRAKLRVAADNRIRSCCPGDKTHSICAPICDVTSRLRLCAILKSPNQTTSADYDIQFKKMCCCDDMDKSSNVDSPYMKSRINPSPKNVMIEDASVKLITVACQTEPAKRSDLKILDPEIYASNPDCKEDSNEIIHAARDETCRKNSVVIDSTIATLNDDVNPPQNADNSIPMKRAIVQSDTQNFASTSLDISDLKGGPLILEIKMLQPLFSIELKRGCKDPEIEELSTTKQISCDCKLLEQSNRDGVISLHQESVIDSNSKNDVISQEQRCMNETTSINSVNCGGQKMMDQEAETVMQKNEKEAVTSGTQNIQICKMGNDSKTEHRGTDDSTSSAPTACIKTKEIASTSLEGKPDCSTDPGQCNISLEAIGLLKNNEDSSEMSIDDSSVKDLATCVEKAIPQPEENSSDVTQSRTIETLISTLETSLQHITDPIIRQKLVNTIQYIEDQDQSKNYSSTEIHPRDYQACGTRENILRKHEMDNNNNKPNLLLSTAKNSECQKSYKSQSVIVDKNSSRNIEGSISDETIPEDEDGSIRREGTASGSEMRKPSRRGLTSTNNEVAADQISTNGRQLAMLSPAGKCYYRNKQSLMKQTLMEQEESLSGRACTSEVRSRSELPLSRSVSKSKMIEDSNNTFHENLVESDNNRSELNGNRSVMSCTFSCSSNEISCDVEDRKYDSNSWCDRNINERLNVVPQRQNYHENYESANYYSCYAQSTEQDINNFASMVASQLRELSTEAALRSQQRIQTLISNSRLKWEKNKKYR